MTVSPLAGKPAPPEMLVDVGALEREYYAGRPDPGRRHRRHPVQ
jgi:phosphoglucomutase